MFLAEVLLGPDLKTEVVHNIVARGVNDTPAAAVASSFFPASPVPLSSLFLPLSPALSRARSTDPFFN